MARVSYIAAMSNPRGNKLETLNDLEKRRNIPLRGKGSVRCLGGAGHAGGEVKWSKVGTGQGGADHSVTHI